MLCSLMLISSFTLCVLQWRSRSITNSKIKLNDASHRFYSSWQFNSFSVSSPLLAFPGVNTIVDCQRTYLVVGLPGLLLPASNLIGSETLSAWACSPSSSSPADAGESSDSTDPWSNASRRCSSRQLKQKLFPSFVIWTFPMIYTQVNFYRHGAQSGIQGDLLLTFHLPQTHVIFLECVTVMVEIF